MKIVRSHNSKPPESRSALPEPQLILGTTQEGYRFPLSGELFAKHKHILGTSGSGKSFFLASLIVQIFAMGLSFCLIDPHGDLARLVLKLLASSNFFSDERAFKKLLYCDFGRVERDAVIPFNILKQSPFRSASRAASDLLTAIHRAFPGTIQTTANLDMMFLNAGYVLSANNLPITRLSDFVFSADFRSRLLRNISDEQVLHFFRYKFKEPGEKINSLLVDSTLKRSWLITFSPTLRKSLGAAENMLDFRSLMDQQISCICNLGGLDQETTKFLGCLLTVSLEQAFLSRALIDEKLRLPYHVFIDEFPLFCAQSHDAFSHMLEQVRKYKGTLYLANQTLGQLAPDIATSLQNALSITMRAGYKDSHELQSNFFRPVADKKQEGFVDGLLRLLGLLPDPPADAFAGITTAADARAVYEHLARQEALISINGRSTRILTNTIPQISVDKKRLQEIEDRYAHLHANKTHSIPSNTVVGSSPVPSPVDRVIVAAVTGRDSLAKRCLPLSGQPIVPLETFVGASGTDEQLQAIFSLYGGYLTVSLLAKLLGKTENTARSKLNKLAAAGVCEQQHIPTTSGRSPTVYFLKKGSRKYEYLFLAHRLAMASLLIHTALLPTVAPEYTIVSLQSDESLKASPLQLSQGSLFVPDGIARIQSPSSDFTIYFECDRNTESREKISSKLRSYVLLASQCKCMTVAFCVVEGGDLRVKTLRTLAQEVLPPEYHELFLFAHLDLPAMSPAALFLHPVWQSPDDRIPSPLVF